MSFYRNTDRGTWGDERVRALSRAGKLLWVYLTCNDHDDLSGLYRLSPAVVQDDLDYTRDEFDAAMLEVEELGLARYDREARVVWVCNMLRKQARTRDGGVGPKQLIHARRQLEALPVTGLKLEMSAYYRSRFGIEIGYCEAAEGVALGSVSASASGSVSVKPDEPVPKPAVVNWIPANDLRDVIEGATGLPCDPEQSRLYKAAAERVESGQAEIGEVAQVLTLWNSDHGSWTRREQLFWSKNWKWVRARYLDKAPTEPTAEANHQRPPPTPEERAQLNNLLAQATKKYGRGGRNE